jgi:hypothetical protein
MRGKRYGYSRKRPRLDPDYAVAYAMTMWCRATRLLYGVADDIERERREVARLWQIVTRVGQEDGVALSQASWAVASVLHDLASARQMVDSDWRAALSSVKGVYLISDTATGKRYVGSAYNDQGIWSRWSGYVVTGHGGNVELRTLVSDPTLEYCRRSFRFALLEYRPSSASDEVILAREDYWKRILLSREHGLNRN